MGGNAFRRHRKTGGRAAPEVTAEKSATVASAATAGPVQLGRTPAVQWEGSGSGRWRRNRAQQ